MAAAQVLLRRQPGNSFNLRQPLSCLIISDRDIIIRSGIMCEPDSVNVLVNTCLHRNRHDPNKNTCYLSNPPPQPNLTGF